MTGDTNLEIGDPNETGSVGVQSKLLPVSFGPYTVMMRLTETDRFLEIVSIHFSQDFRTIPERNESMGFHDVSDLYESKEG
jgi:hypothetical protein